jgi:hypothetical protein
MPEVSSSTTREPPVTAAAAPRPLAPVGAAVAARAFAWSRVPGASLYRVTVFDSAGATLFESDQADTVLRLPDSVAVLPGAPYLWKVAAQVSFDRWASSELVRFRLEGPGRP